jgi:hypothetical protein
MMRTRLCRYIQRCSCHVCASPRPQLSGACEQPSDSVQLSHPAKDLYSMSSEIASGSSAVSLSTYIRSKRGLRILLSAMLAMVAMLAMPLAHAANATTTTLTLSSQSVAHGTVVTLTAAVSNGAAVTTGLVTFCNASATYCDNGAVLGTAQLTSAGTAAIKLVPAIGSHSYAAVFNGTPNGTPANAKSTSSAQPLTVTGTYATATGISPLGSAGNYTLTGTVVGGASPAPTGGVSFVDTTTSTTVASAAFGSSILAQTFAGAVPYGAGTGPSGIAAGDFLGNGKLDLAVVNNTSATVSILVGDGFGGFTLNQTLTINDGGWANGIAVGDFNADGIPDLVVTEYGGSGGSKVDYFQGQANGQFQPLVGYFAGTGSPVSIAVGDFNGDGKADWVVADATSAVVVGLGNGDGTFQPRATYSAGSGPRAVAVADLNGDGILDIATANYGDNTVSVLLGYGDGSFRAPVTYSAGINPAGVAIGDFRGNGVLDLAVASSATVGMLLGYGDGTFQAVVSYPTAGSWVVAIGDFNGDGKADLAVGNYSSGTKVSVLLGNGDGTFQGQVLYTTGTNPDALAVGDFNGDGLADIAAACYNGGVSVLLNQVTATATATQTGVSIPGTGTHYIDASFGGDSNYGSSTSSTVGLTATPPPTTTTLALSSASVTAGTVVTFTASVSNGSPVYPGLVTFCDATATYCENSAMIGTAQLTAAGTAVIKLVPGIGSHSYKAVFGGTNSNGASASSAQPLTVSGIGSGTNPSETAISSSGVAGNYTLTATVTGEGSGYPTGNVSFVDTTGSNTLGSATLSSGTAISAFQATNYGIDHPYGVAVADFNGDGKLDLAVTNYSYQTVSILLGNGDGTFQTAATYATGVNPLALAVGDFNGDGIPDLAVLNSGSSGTVSILLGKGDGTFYPQQTITVGSGLANIVVGDFNGDGKADLVVTYTGNSVILLGKGDGTFTVGSTLGYSGALVAGDFNGDGKLDLAIEADNTTLDILLGNGDGTFYLGHSYTTPANGGDPMAVGDLNGDGKLDLAQLNYYTGTVAVWFGNGDGTFGGDYYPTTIAHPMDVVIGDFNGDGKADLAISSGGSQVGILLGDGAGSFPTQTIYTSGGSFGLQLLAADFNGDGKSDLVVGNISSNNISVLLSSEVVTATAQISGVTVPGLGTQQTDASYAGDSTYSGSISTTIPLTGTGTVTTLALGANPASSTYGQPVTLTATLSTSASSTNNESINFYNGAGLIGSGTLTSGVATLTLSTLPAGTDSLTAVYAGDSTFIGSTSPTVSYAVAKATPTITWATPAAITYGTALSATQLDATASVAGTSFVYTPASGTVLTAGPQPLSVTFTPTDTTDYTTATSGVTLAVNKATPVITWATPAAITYGTALSATQLDATSGGVAGTFVYNPLSGTVLGAGNNQSLAVAFTPGDTTDYNTASGSTTITVNKATPVITWATPAAITYGTALSSTQLDATSGGVVGTFVYTPAVGTVLGAGNNQSLAVAFTPGDATDYNNASGSTTITVNKATPVITWATPVAITYGTALSVTQLNATSGGLAGTFVYTPPSGTVLGAGNNQSLAVAFTPGDATDYNNASGSTTITVNKATPVITWAAPAAITYGTALSATQLNATSGGLAGTFVYTPPSGTVLGAGSNQSLAVAFTPGDTTDYNNASGSTTITVNKATPVITWATPAAITYGTALSATQLNATSGGVAGTFVYTPPSGTVLGAGNNQSLAVAFTPGDTTDYNTASGSTTITVNKATPVITWATPAAITYGTALGATQLDATASVAGTTFVYTPASGTVLTAGPQPLSVTFTPTDTTDYTTATGGVTLTVNKAIPVVTWTTPVAITYGTALSATQLDATASVAGNSFVYTPAAGTVLGAGSQPLSVTFTPTDTTDYTTATGNVTLTVNKATSVITWGTPATIPYGTLLSATQLDATASVPGLFAYNPAAGTTPLAGSDTLSVTFTPTDGTDYTTATGSVTLTVSKATPGITWATPAPIVAGTTLSATQLNATASTGGAFAYNPAAGTTPATGTDTLSVGFTPADAADYTTANASVSLTVVAPPVLAMAFVPNQIALNGTSTLNFAITSPAANTVALAGVAFTDNLPAGLVVAAPNALTNTCGGTPTALAGSQTISLTGASIASGTTCTLTAGVTAAVSSGYTNTSGAVTSTNGGPGNSAYANLLVASGLVLAPASLNFPSQVVGTTSASQSVTLTNNAASVLTVTSVLATGDFAETNTCGTTVGPGGTCTITVTFTPSLVGAEQGSVIVTDSAGIQVVLLTGTGTAPGVGLSPSSLTFGSQTIDTTSSLQISTLTNTGDSSLTIASFTASGDFTVTSPDCAPPQNLTAGGTCTLQVVFSPTAVGSRSGAITIADSVGTHVVALMGTGAAPGVSLSPATLTFGSVIVGANSQLTANVNLDASADAPLQVTAVTVSGDYTVVNNCTALVSPGTACGVSVTFSPVATGVRTGTAVITYTVGTGSGQLILALAGNGSAPGVSLQPPSVAFGSQVTGTTSGQQSVVVSNTGTSALTISSVTAAGDFAETDNCSSVAAGASCTIQVTFTPTSTGVRNGTITLADSAGTQVVALTGMGNAPGVELNPSTLVAASQLVGTSGAAQPVTITNSGSSSLTVNSVTAAGDFTETDNCTAVAIAVAANCTVQVTFSPTAAGTRNGTITLLDSAGTQVIALSGTGNAPGVGLSPPSLAFGSQVIGSTSTSQTVTVSNSGTSALTIGSVTAAGDFAQTNNCTTLAAGTNCAVQATFTPTATGARTGTITLVDDAGSQVISLTGTGNAPGVSLNPSSLTFGSQVALTTSAAQSVIVGNAGTSVLTISSVTAAGDFAQTNNCAAVAAGASCTVQVTFTPTATGARNGTITVTDDAGTQVAALSGTGNAPGVSLNPSTLPFGSQVVGTTSAAQNVIVSNTGTSVLTIASITAAGDFADTTSDCTTVAAGASCTIQVTFTPTATGTRNGNIALVDNAGTQVAVLSGTGNAPGVGLNPSTLTFAGQVVGTTSAAQSVTVTNTGTSLLAISSVTASGDFGQSNNCTSVATGASCTIQATFTPAATGTRNGSITMVDSVGTHVVTLSGTGTAVVIGVYPSALIFGTQTVGTLSAAQSITVSNGGTGSLTISSITASGDFAESSNCTTISPGAICTVQATFTPTATGTRNGNITLVDNAGTQVVSLIGIGTAAGVALNPSTLTFGSQAVGTTSTAQSVVVSNGGTSALTITSVIASGDFAQTSNCTTIAVSANCTINVTFTPTVTGNRNGTVTLVDNVGVQVVTLTGGAVEYALAPVSGSSLTASVTAGKTATYQVVVSALNFNGSVALMCLGAPQGSTCTAQPSSVQMTGTNSANVTVNVTTTAATTQATAGPMPKRRGMPVWPWLPGVAGVLFLPWRRDVWRGRSLKASVLLGSLLLLLSLSACGGGSLASPGTGATPSGTYKLMLVGTSGDNVQHSLEMTLEVK